MGQQPSDVLYQLESYTINNTNIVTGVKLFETDQDWTIAFDATLTSNPTTGDGSSWRLACSWDNVSGRWVFNLGKRTSTLMSFAYMESADNYIALSGIDVGTGRYRFVLTHAKNSDSATLRIRKDSGAVQTFSRSNTFASSASSVLFGGGSLVQRLPTGVINQAIIYNKVLSASEINAFLGV